MIEGGPKSRQRMRRWVIMELVHLIVLSIDAARKIRQIPARYSIPEAGEHEMAQAP